VPALVTELDQSRVLMHPFVVGELACGNLKNRREILQLLGDLPGAPVASDREVLEFIERRALMGRGLGTSTFTCLFRWLSPEARSSGRAIDALLP